MAARKKKRKSTSGLRGIKKCTMVKRRKRCVCVSKRTGKFIASRHCKGMASAARKKKASKRKRR